MNQIAKPRFWSIWAETDGSVYAVKLVYISKVHSVQDWLIPANYVAYKFRFLRAREMISPHLLRECWIDANDAIEQNDPLYCKSRAYGRLGGDAKIFLYGAMAMYYSVQNKRTLLHSVALTTGIVAISPRAVPSGASSRSTSPTMEPDHSHTKCCPECAEIFETLTGWALPCGTYGSTPTAPADLSISVRRARRRT